MAIADSQGSILARYTYDSWGNILSITDNAGNDVSANAKNIGTINPLRYRGYYYDSETGLYYLKSRFYDPATGRFVNADGFVSTGTGLLGTNMYAYCENNPICKVDFSGYSCICYILANCPCDPVYDPVCTEKTPCAIYLKRHPNARPTKSYKIDNIRICTDGSKGDLVPDDNWREDTAFYNGGNYLDAYEVPYIVLPGAGSDRNAASIGDRALLINHDTGMSVDCIVGERAGPDISIMGEVSIKAIWDTGNPNHMTANDNTGLSNNYEIILYPGTSYFSLSYSPYSR